MAGGAFGLTPFDTKVEIWLETHAGLIVDLAQSSDTVVVADEPVQLPPMQATVVISVDGREHRSEVHLPNGMKLDDRETLALPVDDIPI